MTKIQEAARWMRNVLADGPVPARVMRSAGQRAGYQIKTMAAARTHANVEAIEVGFHGGWWWRIRGDERKPTKPAAAKDTLVCCSEGHTYSMNTALLPRVCVVPTCSGVVGLPTDNRTEATESPYGVPRFDEPRPQSIWRSRPSPLRSARTR